MTIAISIVMRDLLNQVNTANYDFVVIDTPSTSSNELFNLSLSIPDFAVMTYSPNKLQPIKSWLNKIKHVQEIFNPELRVGGILRTRFNDIEDSHIFYSREVYRRYPEYYWNSIFLNSPLFLNIDSYSIQKPQVTKAFKPVYDELILRLLKRGNGSELW
ncbi:ParA family protein [Paenibacillus sp. NRS-1760]|uniref:ParA family protein n=1 Tax=Paenibacillus sp. NRS-1760 TaxID=3233902 RepID=UPI003D2E6B15